jgi:hypothetical protein
LVGPAGDQIKTYLPAAATGERPWIVIGEPAGTQLSGAGGLVSPAGPANSRTTNTIRECATGGRLGA